MYYFINEMTEFKFLVLLLTSVQIYFTPFNNICEMVMGEGYYMLVKCSFRNEMAEIFLLWLGQILSCLDMLNKN